MSGQPTPNSPTLFETTARWFERAEAALLGALPCRRGCAHCCVGLFPVTVLDRQEIRRGLRSLPENRRRAVEQRAAEQVAAISAAAPHLPRNGCIDQCPDREIDILVARHSDLPCPALQADGSCGIYDFRPLTCRSMGIPPVIDGAVQGACAVQTAVPLIRLSGTLREEEDRLARAEAEELARVCRRSGSDMEELLLPYTFLPESGDQPA